MAVRTEDVVMLLVAMAGMALVVLVVLALVSKSPTAQQQDGAGEEEDAVGGEHAPGLRRRVRAAAAGGEEVEEAHAVAGMTRRQLHKEAKRRAREEQRKFEEAERKARQDRLERKAAARRAVEEEREKEERERLLRAQQEASAEMVVDNYEEWKKAFELQQAGQEIDDETGGQAQQTAEQFISYITEHRIVVIEDLAAAFHMSASTAIDRIRELEAMGRLTGVMDERGKYVYVTEQEMDQVAQLLRRKGRISVSELTYETNKILARN